MRHNKPGFQPQGAFMVADFLASPALKIQSHAYSEALHQALWCPIAPSAGRSYSQMMDSTVLPGIDASGDQNHQMLDDEVGYATGTPAPDDMEEEMRAEQFVQVAQLAYAMLTQRLADTP